MSQNQTTQSVIALNPNCKNNSDYSGLIKLRTNPYTYDLIGRTSGDNIKFNLGLLSSYKDLKMRRKAEILQYKSTINSNSPGYTRTTSQNYNTIIKGTNPNGYSNYRLKKILDTTEKINCNVVTGRPSSNSGIWFNDTSPESSGGLYLNKSVLFHLRL
jgi:hypothetical protein